MTDKLLVIGLHGCFSQGDLLKSHLKSLIHEFSPQCQFEFPTAPRNANIVGYGFGRIGHKWLDIYSTVFNQNALPRELKKASSDLEDATSELIDAYKVTPKQTLVIGHSQGALMALSLATKMSLATVIGLNGLYRESVYGDLEEIQPETRLVLSHRQNDKRIKADGTIKLAHHLKSQGLSVHDVIHDEGLHTIGTPEEGLIRKEIDLLTQSNQFTPDQSHARLAL